MGNVCCCMQVEEIQDYINRHPSTYRNCICFNCFVQNFVNVYTTLFQRGEVQAIPSSIEGAASRTTSASTEDSFSDMYRSPPRPLPYDVDPRSVCAPQSGLVPRREKGSSHTHEESEPLRAYNDVGSDSLHSGGNWKEYGRLQEENIKAALKLSLAETTADAAHFYATTAEDEDVCPTCLDEYTPENPKIVTKCSHHFHLGCIYEWMERSDSCPVCGKVMMFDETS